MAFTAAFAAVSGVACAEGQADWTALVIGNTSRNAPRAFADSFNVSEVLKQAGLGTVTLERDIGADAMAAALAGLNGQARVLLYFAGPLNRQTAGTILMGAGGGDARSELGGVLNSLAKSGTTEAVVLIEDCSLLPGAGEGMAGKLVPITAPPGLQLFLAASAGPEGACGPSPLTDRLTAPSGGATLADRLAGLWIGADPGPGFGPSLGTSAAPASTAPAAAETATSAPAPEPAPESAPESAPGATAVASATPEPAPQSDVFLIDTETAVILPVENEVTVLTVTPAASATTETLTAARASASDLATADDQTVVFIAPPPTQIAALPLAQGLPEPSIIVGLIEANLTTYDTVDEAPAAVTQSELSFDNLEARLALKTQDEELYRSLVESGAFDPPDGDIARALQTELSRMGCYRSAIDGAWGNGSRASVDRYFAELDGKQPVSREATIELYRQILMEKDVECPAPVVAQQAAPQSSNRNQGTQAAPRAAAPAPAPAPAPAAPSGGLNSSTALGGVFR